MEQTPGSSGNPHFRSNIPAYAAPDRAEWTRVHGENLQPYELEDVPKKFLTRAEGAVVRDASTIAFDDAVNAQARMETVNDEVAFHCDLDDLVFFDPQTNSFWVYPE